jgi:hypothetical protein
VRSWGTVSSRAGRGVGEMAAGESLRLIARRLGKRGPSVRASVLQTGGEQQHPPRRSVRWLNMAEREEISRGVAAGRSRRGWGGHPRRCRGCSTVGGSGEASAGPPEAEPSEQDGDGDKDAGFGPLQRPEVVGGVVGEVLAQAEAPDPVGTHLGCGVGPAVLRVGGSGEDLAGGGDRLVGQDQASGRLSLATTVSSLP